MKLLFMPEAEEALFEIAMWVEEQNTKDSGARFIDKFIDKIADYAIPYAQYAKCSNKVLSFHNYSCIAIQTWVVVFKKTKNEFVVHHILYGAGLK